MKVTHTMNKVFAAVASRWELQVNTIRFSYKGEVVKDDDTPEKLEMDEFIALVRVNSQNDVSKMW